MSELLDLFPGLARGGYTITSARSQLYNCIAWAAGDMQRWWWPGPPDAVGAFWPTGVAREETLAAFRAAFASLGFHDCDSADSENGFEKIALFADEQGVPRHAARQRPNGRWTSKLGELEDIEHALYDLEGQSYGAVAVLMKRPL